MGRVNKKKMAELAEAAENDEQDKKSNASVAGDEHTEKVSGNRSEDEDLEKDPISNAGENNKTTNSNDAADEGDDEDDEMHDALSSVNDDDYVAAEVNDSNKNSKKRKAVSKKPAAAANGDDADNASVADSDDMPLNGGKKPRKSGATKAAKKAGGSKAASKKTLTKAAKKATAKKAAESEQDDADAASENEAADDGSEEEEYEVQDIIEEKVERGVTYYLIRWKGYTKDDDTWEPADTLSCPDIIEKFKKKKSSGKSKSNGSKPPKKSKGKGTKSPGDGGSKSKKNKKKVDPNAEWEVEKIINYAEEKGERIFRIRWKGFKATDDTWEPESNLNCKDIIEKFMERMNQNANLTFKELREEPKKTKRLVNETAPRTDLHNAVGRKSKRAGTKKRIYYGDSDD